ncbi:hypothetical protein JTB14_001773 [Gonioctena quinquepunctata]|nr:hypothetical protein JTB14_001773 [Gonioctena quinquepunctata]
MRGKLGIKSKVISISPGAPFIKRKIKRERSRTAQRWSRRIRSLPPIPINVLKTRRVRKTRSVAGNGANSSNLSNQKKQSLRVYDGDKKHQEFQNKSFKNSRSVDILKIVPVVVYIKDDKTKCKSISDDVEIQIKQKYKCTPRAFNKILQDNVFQRRIKKECSDLEKRWSKRLRTLPANTFNM